MSITRITAVTVGLVGALSASPAQSQSAGGSEAEIALLKQQLKLLEQKLDKLQKQTAANTAAAATANAKAAAGKITALATAEDLVYKHQSIYQTSFDVTTYKLEVYDTDGDVIHTDNGNQAPFKAGGYAAAKEQLLRHVDDTNPDPQLAALEARIMDEANKLDIGPMGFGGSLTVGCCKITARNRLPASFFVSISYMCWAFRRQGVTLDAGGKIEKWLY